MTSQLLDVNMMEMKIDKKHIKKLRLERALSQSELAAMTGLSLRTVQRIEKTGVCSLESLKSLAAVFETQVNTITEKKKQANSTWVIACFSLSLLFGALFILPVAANPIMLNLKMTNKAGVLADVQLLNNEDLSVLKIDNQFKLTFKVQQLNDEDIKISVQIFQINGDKQHLIGSPEVITQNRNTAEIIFNDSHLYIEPEA